MKVRSEDLSRVRFPEGRRGYDGNKVDAVLSEIIETLREYEAADEALHRTFVEAQRIKDEIIAEANVEADQVRAESEELKAAGQIEAERLIAAAKDDATEQRVATEGNVARAKAEIDQRIAEAEGQAAEKVAAAARDAASARAEAAEEADSIRIEAKAEASSKLKAAKKESTAMLAEAKAEHADLSRKVPQLRTAVSDIRARLIELAESAQDELGVVDGMIDLASEEAVPAVEASAAEEPATTTPEPAPAKEEEKREEEAPKGEPAAVEIEMADEITGDLATEASKAWTLKNLAGDLNDAAPEGEPKETFYGSGLRRRLTENTKPNKGR